MSRLRVMGRPTKFSRRLATEICEAIAANPVGLDRLCDDREHFPDPSTIYRWAERHADFREDFARARERRADRLFDECIEIADTPQTGVETVTKPDGTIEVREGDMLGHRRLQVETRLKMAAKLAPRKYGERLEIDGAMTLAVVAARPMTEEEWAESLPKIGP